MRQDWAPKIATLIPSKGRVPNGLTGWHYIPAVKVPPYSRAPTLRTKLPANESLDTHQTMSKPWQLAKLNNSRKQYKYIRDRKITNKNAIKLKVTCKQTQ